MLFLIVYDRPFSFVNYHILRIYHYFLGNRYVNQSLSVHQIFRVNLTHHFKSYGAIVSVSIKLALCLQVLQFIFAEALFVIIIPMPFEIISFDIWLVSTEDFTRLGDGVDVQFLDYMSQFTLEYRVNDCDLYVWFIVFWKIKLDDLAWHRGCDLSLQFFYRWGWFWIVDFKEFQWIHAVICQHQRRIQGDNILKGILWYGFLWQTAIPLNVDSGIEIFIKFDNLTFQITEKVLFFLIRCGLAESSCNIIKYQLLFVRVLYHII